MEKSKSSGKVAILASEGPRGEIINDQKWSKKVIIVREVVKIVRERDKIVRAKVLKCP